MIWRLHLAKRAQKRFSRVPPKDRRQILAALDQMSINPFTGNITPLKTRPLRFRRRVGAYRIFFRLDPDQDLTIIVSAIDRRTTTTYRQRQGKGAGTPD